jgi:hypothetical protein
MRTDYLAALALCLVAVVIAVTVPRLSTHLCEDDAKQRLDVIAENAEVSVGLLREANATLKEVARQQSGDRWATFTVEDRD